MSPIPHRHLTLTFLVTLLIDQVSKWYIFEHVLRLNGDKMSFLDWLIHTQSIEATLASFTDYTVVKITSFFNLVTVWNTGVSFGFLQDSANYMPTVLTIFAFIMSLILFIWARRTTHKVESLSLVLIASGAFGNAFDRLRFKGVADFIDIHYNGWHWPAFNVADSAIFIGAVLLLIYSFRSTPKNDVEPTEKDT